MKQDLIVQIATVIGIAIGFGLAILGSRGGK